MPQCRLCRQTFSGTTCPSCGTIASAGRTQAVLRPRGRSHTRRIVRAASGQQPPWRSQPSAAIAGRDIQPREVRGTVIESQRIGDVEEPTNPWKRASAALFLIAIFPLACTLMLFSLALKIAFGSQRHAGGRSLFDEILLHQLLGAVMRPRRMVPVWAHIVETDTRHVLARQTDNLESGVLLPGHEVSLTGRWHRGELVVGGGHNHTVGAALARPFDVWPVAFLCLVAVVFVEYAALLGMIEGSI